MALPDIDRALEWLRTGVPPAADLQKVIGGFRDMGDHVGFLAAHRARDRFVRQVSYGVPSREAVEALAARPLLEIGAGTGYWSALVAAAGGDVVATDRAPMFSRNGYGHEIGRFHPTVRMRGAAAVRTWPERDVLCVWPCYMGRWPAYAALAVAPGRTLHVVGEAPGGATASDWFHRVYEDRFERVGTAPIASWRGVHDQFESRIRT